jgi:hypothetical protein
MRRQQKSRRRWSARELFCLANDQPGTPETEMGLFARFFRYSIDTYGGAPILLVIMLIQIALLGWVLVEGLRARAERGSSRLSTDVRRIRAAHRAEIWQKQVRPLALTMMLLGPGIGLGMSTLLGALGMGALGDVMGTQAGADALASTPTARSATPTSSWSGAPSPCCWGR